MRALLLFAPLAFASPQTPAQNRSSDSARSPGAAVGLQVQSAGGDTAAISREIAQRRVAGDTYLPNAEHFTFGDRSVAANTVVDGPIAIARGNLDVFGTVNGDVIALDGDVRVHKGARVTGNAWAAAGRVVVDGGVVEGEKGAVNAAAAVAVPVTAGRRAPLSTWQSIKLVIGWLALLTIIGLGVMIFAEGNLDGVVTALERERGGGVARAFWLGVAGQLVMLPGLLVLVVGLAITLIGVLLIPFAIVAYVIAVAGLVTLGFLAVARLTGGALAWERGTTSARGVHLRGLILGLAIYFAVWMVAALFAWSPVIGAVLRALAIAMTWVAATTGLGAAITSRAGTVRPGVGSAERAAADEFAWQTPTPVSGVVASTRRAVSSPR